MNDAGERFSLSYGQLERLLLAIDIGSKASIVSRFRKLRPKFAPDQLLSKPGVRVSYDLSRVLSIAAVFGLNSVAVPQGDAVDMVVASWPEIARAAIGAHGGPTSAAGQSGSVVRIHVDAFPLNGPPGSWASIGADAPEGLPFVAIDVGPVIRELHALADAAGTAASLRDAVGDLERTFGWEQLVSDADIRLPERLESGFFATGPYFERARALLAVKSGASLSQRDRLRFQAHLDYLEGPPPIDSWKRFIVTEGEKVRLVQLLAAKGLELGLRSTVLASQTLITAASPTEPRALVLIEKGERKVAELAKGGA